MKKLILTAVAVMFFVGMVTAPAFARGWGGGRITNIIMAEEKAHTIAGAKLVAPKLIGLKQISDYLFLGFEVGKDVMVDPFRKDTRSYVEDDRGAFIYFRITYDGCLLNCPGK